MVLLWDPRTEKKTFGKNQGNMDKLRTLLILTYQYWPTWYGKCPNLGKMLTRGN